MLKTISASWYSMQPGKLSIQQVVRKSFSTITSSKTHMIIESAGPAEVFDWKNVGK